MGVFLLPFKGLNFWSMENTPSLFALQDFLHKRIYTTEYPDNFDFCSHMCHSSTKVLEVFVTDEAIKTFSFVAFFIAIILRL
jgi:hypothetical protein